MRWRREPLPYQVESRLAMLRLNGGLTQVQLSAMAGVTVRTINRLERCADSDKRGIGLLAAYDIAKAIGCTLDEYAEAYRLDRRKR